MTLLVHGIPNCDSVRRARAWLDEHGVEHRFRDLRAGDDADGGRLEREELERWADACGWQSLMNKRSATFRALSDEEKRIGERGAALDLMLRYPTLIKRPIAAHEDGDRVLVGFNESEWENAFC